MYIVGAVRHVTENCTVLGELQATRRRRPAQGAQNLVKEPFLRLLLSFLLRL